MSKIVMFPGQGSQTLGMGEELFVKYREVTQKASDFLKYDIVALCKEGPAEKLNSTEFTQPALYTVSALTYMKMKEEGISPVAVCGHSLGEYAALYAAGVIDFETGLSLVAKRGEIMSRTKGGKMAAVIGLEADEVVKVISLCKEGKDIDVANFNSPGQIVISGTESAIESSADCFKENGAKRYLPLPVSGAFHSRYMKDAADEFAKYLDTVTFQNPTLPIIANVTARPYENGKIKEMLVSQIFSSVRWIETVEYLSKTYPGAEFVECGPGAVLAGLVKRIVK